jgi:hypothetical protein
MHAWILSLILSLAPNLAPAQASRVADAIEKVSTEHPLFKGDDAVPRTVAQFVAVAFDESTFRPDAVGDHGRSIGLMQIGVSNLAELGMTKDDLLDPEKNLLAAARLMRASHRTCAARPPEYRLAHYASGGPTCDVSAGLRASILRTRLSERLYETLL